VADEDHEVNVTRSGGGPVRESHGADPTCLELAWWVVRVLAVSVVLGLIIGMVLGWGSVVVVRT